MKSAMIKTHTEIGKCPSCGKHIGDKPACKYCCRLVGSGVSEKTLILTTIPVILIGIFLLYLGATTETDVSLITSLDAEDNFKHVRIVGTVTKLKYREGKYGHFGVLEVMIRDDSSEEASLSTLKMKAEDDVIRDMIERDIIPSIGDIVDLQGTLYAGKGYRTLNLNSARLLRIKQRSTVYENRSVSELLSTPLLFNGKEVTVRNAVVIDDGSPRRFRIVDAGSSGPALWIYGTTVDQILKGESVTVRGLFTFYERGGYWQIMIRSNSSDLVLVGKK